MTRTLSSAREKPDRDRDMTEGLLRQRRNLMLSSLAVIFFYLGDVQITEISLLGTKILLRNEVAVHISLWFFFAYFFYRYTIYYFEEPLEEMLKTYNDILDQLASKKFKKLALKQNNQNIDSSKLGEIVNKCQFSLVKSDNHKKISCLRAETYGSTSTPTTTNVSAIYWRAYFIFHRVWACLTLAFKDSRVSDYWFPFLLASVSLVVGAVNLITRLI